MKNELPFSPLKPYQIHQAEPFNFFSIVSEVINQGVIVKEMEEDFINPRHFRDTVTKPANQLIKDAPEIRRFIPHFSFVWGKNERGQQTGFIVMKKVDGIPLEAVDTINEATARELDCMLSLFFRLRKQVRDAKSQEHQSPDFLHLTLTANGNLGFHNIMVGTLEGEQDETIKPYYIDLYPLENKAKEIEYMDSEPFSTLLKNALKRLKEKSNNYPYPLTAETIEQYLAT